MKDYSERISQYSILRCFATFFAIVGHACSWYQLTYPITVSYSGYPSVLSSSVETYIYSFHMPLFFFLSGAVFALSAWNDDQTSEFLKKKVKRLLVPYFLVGLLYMFPVKTIFGYFQIPEVYETVAAFPYTTQESGYLWYLAVLFGVFSLYTLLKLVLPPKWEIWVLFLCVFAYVFDFFFPFKAFWEISSFYFMFFLFGYFFNHFRKRLDSLVGKYPIIAFFVFSIYFYLFFFRNKSTLHISDQIQGLYMQRCIERTYDILSALISCLMWYMFSALICSIMPRLSSSGFVKTLDRESLAMYLIHDPLNYPVIMLATSRLWQASGGVLSPVASIILFLVRSIGVYLVSLLIAVLIRNIPKTDRIKKTAVIAAASVYVLSVFLSIFFRNSL